MSRLLESIFLLAMLVGSVSAQDSEAPSFAPSFAPSTAPSASPSAMPSSAPSSAPSAASDTDTESPVQETEARPVCVLEPRISCETADGVDCRALRTPRFDCKNNAKTVNLKFSWQRCSDLDREICEDHRIVSNTTSVICSDAEKDSVLLFVGSVDMEIDNLLTLEKRGKKNRQKLQKLPDTIKCVVYDYDVNGTTVHDGAPVIPEDSIIQTVLFDKEGLTLKDTRGSFEVVGCEDRQCLVDMTFTYEVTNTNSSDIWSPSAGTPVNVTRMDLLSDLTGAEMDDIKDDLVVDGLKTNTLYSGQTGKVEKEYKVNICDDEMITLDAVLVVDQEGTNEEETTDECVTGVSYSLAFRDPVCKDVKATMKCTYRDANGKKKKCSDMPSAGPRAVNQEGYDPMQCNCMDNCVQKLQFKFTGDLCVDKVEGLPEFGCTDFMTLPDEEGLGFHLMILSGEGGVYYNSPAYTGDDIVIESDTCISDKMSFYTGSDSILSKLYSSVACVHHCAANDSGNGLRFDTSLGPIEFTGYTCKDGFSSNEQQPVDRSERAPVSISNETCLQELTFEYCLKNKGKDDLEVDGGTFMVKPLDGVYPAVNQTMLLAKERTCWEKNVTIDRCGEGDYAALFEATATVKGTDQTCVAETSILFEILSPTDNATPGSSPGDPPVVAPGPSPSGIPNSFPAIINTPNSGFFAPTYTGKGKGGAYRYNGYGKGKGKGGGYGGSPFLFVERGTTYQGASSRFYPTRHFRRNQRAI